MNKAFLNRYVRFLAPFIDLARPVKVVFDASNGPAGHVVWRLLANHPLVQATFLDSKVSGRFPAHGPDSSRREAQFHVARAVVKRGADLGVLFDGDGDRALFFDHRGRWVSPLAVAHLLFMGSEPPFIADPIVARGLEKMGVLRSPVYRTKVGSFFIKKEMWKHHASVGAEYSSHYYFKEFFGCDSGVLAAVKVLNAVSKLPYPLADFTDLLSVPSITSFTVPADFPERMLTRLAQAYRSRAKHVGRTDGISVDGGGWWFTVRLSNTEPLLRVVVGAFDRRVLVGEVHRLRELLKSRFSRETGKIKKTR
jgi:phosphomannomutase